MAFDSKVNVDLNNDSLNPEDISNMLDLMVSDGISRIKVNVSEDDNFDGVRKEYHHGRCDINSPFACGTVFDLLNDDE